MTLNALTVDLTEAQLHYFTIGLEPNYPPKQENKTINIIPPEVKSFQLCVTVDKHRPELENPFTLR